MALPAVQAEFGVARADATLPYTLTIIGFMIGGKVLSREYLALGGPLGVEAVPVPTLAPKADAALKIEVWNLRLVGMPPAEADGR